MCLARDTKDHFTIHFVIPYQNPVQVYTGFWKGIMKRPLPRFNVFESFEFVSKSVVGMNHSSHVLGPGIQKKEKKSV